MNVSYRYMAYQYESHVLNTCLNVNISICNLDSHSLSVCLSACLYLCLWDCLWVRLFAFLSDGLSARYALATPSVLKCFPNMQRSFSHTHTHTRTTDTLKHTLTQSKPFDMFLALLLLSSQHTQIHLYADT